MTGPYPNTPPKPKRVDLIDIKTNKNRVCIYVRYGVMPTMRAFVATAVLAITVGSLFHVFRESVPAHDKWGAHSDYCNTTGPAVGTTAVEDPISSFTSVLYVVAAWDDPGVAMIGGVLAAASFMLHAHETDGSRALDWYTARSMPLAIALLRWPPVAATAVFVALILQYEVGVDDWIVTAVGGGIAVLNIGRLLYIDFYRTGNSKQGPDMSHICAALLLLGAGLALRGGPRNDAICTNDRALAFAYDCRHGAWHVATAALVWLSVAIFRGKPRSRPIAFAAAAALPALTRLVDQFGVHYEAWLVATVWSVVALVAVCVTDVHL